MQHGAPDESQQLPTMRAHDLEAGDMLAGRYRIDRFIAQGAMGVVYDATDVMLGRRTAIKVARVRPEHERQVQRLLFNEARAAAKLRGDHVTKVYEIGRLPSGAPFVVMEYLEGEDLESLLQREGRLGVREAVGYMLQACVALAEVHAVGLVHGDIKPENLFLARMPDGSTKLKLLDFGASAMLSRCSGERGGEPIGTPLYMAPERLREGTHIDPRSDVWSLGAVLYELVGGSAPFDAETIGEIVRRTLLDEPIPLCRVHTEVSPFFDGVVMRCLNKVAARRFPDMRALAAALSAYGPAGSHELAERARRTLASVEEQSDGDPLLLTVAAPPQRRRLPSEPLLLTRSCA